MTDNSDFKEDSSFVIKKSVVRSIAHDHGVRVDPEFISGLNDKVVSFLKDSFVRAKLNNRSTAMKRDL